MVDDAERGEIIRAASAAPVVVVTPGVDLPDGPEPGARPQRARRPRVALLHVGHHRRAEGRDAHAREHAGELRSAAARLALGRRRPAGARAPAVPRARSRGRAARHAAVRSLGGAPPALRRGRGARRRARARRDALLRRTHDVRAPGGVTRASPSWRGSASACRVRRHFPHRCTRRSRPTRASACSSATA